MAEKTEPTKPFEIDAHFPCPECGQKTVRLLVKASTTIGFICTNPKCAIHGQTRPPEELS